MVILVKIVGRYVGLECKVRFFQMDGASVVNQIRLLGGQCKMILEVNALDLLCYIVM